MPITFTDQVEANEYIEQRAIEGYKCIKEKSDRGRWIVKTVGKSKSIQIEEEFGSKEITQTNNSNLEGMKEPVIRDGPTPGKKEVDKAIDNSVKKAVSSSKGKVGMLLSGGVDSVLLLEFVTRYNKTIPVFTVVSDTNHPDLKAAEKVAKQYNLEHYILVTNDEDVERAKKALTNRGKLFKGDVAVYLALELAKDKKIKTVLAGDGIDELTGGYWMHLNTDKKFSNKEDAFKYYWSKLNENHIKPLLDSAEKVGINVRFPFLDKELVSTLNRIPIEERVKNSVTKSWWKDFARGYLSEDIVNRKKIGFVDALEND